MKKIIIAGISDFSAVMLEIISREKLAQVIGFTLSKDYIKQEEYMGLPLFPFEELQKKIDISDIEILLTFGYSQLNYVRELMFNNCKNLGYKISTYISRNALVYSDSIGEGSIVMPNTYIGPFSKIGYCNIVWNGVNISHHNNIGNFNNISAGTIIAGNVEIGNNCFIGVNCAIKNEVKIASRCLLSAGSYMSKNTKENVAYAGNPAKSINGMTALEVINLVK